MALPIGSENRSDLRKSIGYNLRTLYMGEATSDGSTTTIIDKRLKGGDQDYRGAEVVIVSATNDIEEETSVVQSYDSDTDTLILSPALTAVTKDGDTYELHTMPGPTVPQLDNAINQAIIAATDDCLIDHIDETLEFNNNAYEYTIPTTFVALREVAYISSVGIDTSLHDCTTAWDESTDTDVTSSVDTDFISGSCIKLVVADGCGASDIFATDDISETDISDCDVIKIIMHSSIALTAGHLKLLLDDTASCASPVETLSIPATTANTWTTHYISLANPQSDSAIISIGIENDTDVGACTLRVKDVRAQHTGSRNFVALSPDNWEIVQGSTPKLKFNSAGYNTIGDGSILRLQGYKIASELSDDSTAVTIDPDYIVNYVTAKYIEDKNDKDFYMGLAEKRLLQARTPLGENTRFIQR